MNIAICDDDKIFLQAIESTIGEIFSMANIDANIYTYENCYDLVNSIERYKFSLYFLDIDIGFDDGIELARDISNKDSSSVFIFVTSQNERVYEVFSLDTFGFVRKSHLDIDLNEVMERLIRRYSDMGQAYEIISSSKKHYITYLRDIEYIERVDKNIFVGMKNKGVVETVYRTFTALPFQIDFLVEIHRGVYVNMRYVKNIGNDDLILYSGKSLPISRRKRKSTLEAFRAYILD